MRRLFFPLLLISNFCFGQVNLNLGLRAYYPFSGNANDASGNNNNPVFNNATLTADRLGNANSAYHFNGSNTYMKVANSASLNMGNTMSIALWVKPTGYYTGPCYNNMMVSKGDADYLTGNYSLRFSDAYTGCSASPTTTQERFYGENVLAPTPLVQLNQWYSVVWTYDGAIARLYVNCELKMTTVVSTPTFTNAYDLYLGHLNNGSYPYWLNGDLDEVRIYDRALTADEVNVFGGCAITTPCNNWLHTQGVGQSVTVGDLDVSGNQITVEANFNCSSFPISRPDKFEDIVSKHSNTTDINYDLRMDMAGITTTNGQFLTPVPCDNLALNKTFHVALVYDGTTLKFYRNGFLMSQIAATGNLILNDWLTTIGDYAVNNPVGTNFLGYINEVRIWNVARTQSQLQTYMNASLPSPATQTGLMGYYTFDDLLNKQGNAAYNGTLNGGATINNTNPNCTFTADSCALAIPCDNWLYTPSNPSYVTVGDVDVTGNQLTVEATYNRTFPLNNGLYPGHLVSKHSSAVDLNYALFPNGCSITTSISGYKETYENCPVQLNKTYHVAMVYDGSTLKFYRNGFLHSQVPCTGNLVNNDLATTIAEIAAGGYPLNPQFLGYVNEVRIWNVARTQSQLQSYMNSSLPNPTSTAGLLAYYSFNSLVNKQGNAAFNGTLGGAASLNGTNPDCNFIADSCTSAVNINNIINTYTPVLALNPCDNKITVEDASSFNVGDTVLMIQMKGAVVDSTNTAAFGTITDYKNAGNYEFNYIKSKSGNILEFKNKLTRQYDVPVGKVQLVRAPYYPSVNVTATLTCPAWDGSKGGVLVLNVKDSITLNANIDVSGMGFRGGNDPVSIPPGFNCNENQFYYPVNPDLASEKGEGIAIISAARSFGKGAIANGGGSGISHNSGGGGGANISAGGFGGYQFEGAPCNGTVPFDNRGIGGNALTYSNAIRKIFMGGGGGAGHSNNPEAFQAKGGNGGGIIIILGNKMISNNIHKIITNGNAAPTCSLTNNGCHEGMGGGGAGGATILDVHFYIDNLIVENKGGNGANMTSTGNLKVGPGGGGGGGMLWTNGVVIPGGWTVNNSGGLNGVCTGYANDPWGSSPGATGDFRPGLISPIDTVLFKINIDSVRIKDSLLNCNGFDFKGLAYTNTNPIVNWHWDFGDANSANTQNTSHAYGLAGTYTVKLIVTDINGCRDSISKDVVALPGIVADAGNDTSVCSNGPVTLQLHGSGNGTYSWTPAIYLNNPVLQNPTATISATTVFYLTVTGVSLCSSVDSVTITINPVPLTQTLPDTPICRGSVLVLTTTPGSGTYSWTPASSVSNPNIASPQFTDIVSQMMIVTNTNGFGCSAKDTVNVTVKPLPVVKTIEDTTICSTNPLTLFTNGAQTYSWTPVIFLSNPTIASPVYSGNLTQIYYVTGTGTNGCSAKDTVSVTVHIPRLFQAPPDKTMCNNTFVELDGFNGTTVDYLWSPGAYLSSTIIINPIANPPSSRAYNVFIRDRACNTDSNFTVQVIISPGPVTSAGKLNDIDCAHHSAQLFASGGTQYIWSPASGLNNASIANPVATITGTQKYYVTVTDGSGCTSKDSVTVLANTAASLSRYMPNAFTPNGDTRNDCYGLPRWFYIRNLQFIIYNRWGEKVFATGDPHACWDGNYRGKKAEPGIYVFYIKAQTDCGDEEQKGTFLLIR